MEKVIYTRGGEPNDTCLQGYVTADYTTLVALFGEPGGGEYKTEAEWCITTPEGVATIYDYKVGKKYCGEEGLSREDITEWHVGGKNERVVWCVERILEQYMQQDREELYTTATLKAINQSYDHEHQLNESDVTYANVYKMLIEVSRSNHAPKPGDVLEMGGKLYHIDAVENEYLAKGKLTLCENAYVPFLRAKVGDSRTTFSLSTSGGPWSSTEAEGVKLVGKKYKTFCFFGHSGACGNGAVDLRAQVNVWTK